MPWSVELSVVFRLVVFRPFPSEVVLAKVKTSDESGIRGMLIGFKFLPLHKSSIIRPVSVGFFDDMHIPLSYLPSPSALCVLPMPSPYQTASSSLFFHASDPNERAHFWLPSYEPPEDNPDYVPTQHELLDSPISERMYIDASEIVRVRIESDEFHDDEPGPPKAAEGVMLAKAERRRPPYSIVVNNIDMHGVFLQCL